MRILLTVISLCMAFVAFSQKNVTTFGIQFKPIVPSKYFDTGEEFIQDGDVDFTFTPRLGVNFGMLIRQGFTKNLSLETGISMVRRNYTVSSFDNRNQNSLDLRYAFVGYEIPVQGLFYVQLGSQMWMNAAGGVSFDFYPSNIFSNSFASEDTLDFELEQTTFRYSWVQMSVSTNLGFEYRTKKDGYFYLGASFHQPLTDIALSRVTYTLNRVPQSVEHKLSGVYLTLDFRYFFHEKPVK